MNVKLPDGTIITGIPDGTTKAQLIEKLKNNGYDTSGLEDTTQPDPQAAPADAPADPQAAPAEDASPQYQPFGEVKKNVDPATLSQDKDWVTASREIYKMNNGKDFQGSPEEAAQYGLDTMGWFNYNLPAMGIDAARLRSVPQRQKEAFLYLMDTYDNLNMSWGGVGRAVKGMATDPTNLIGLGTLGIGSIGVSGAKAATKLGIKQLLKQGLRTGAVAGVEGGIYAGTDNAIRQSVEVTAGRKDSVSGAELGASVAAGAGTGLVLGTAADAAASKVAELWKKPKVDLPVAPAETPSVRPDVSTSAADQAAKDAPVAQEAPQAPAQEQPAAQAQVTQQESAVVAQEAPKPQEEPGKALKPYEAPTGDFFEFTNIHDLPLPKAETTIPYQRQNLQENMTKAFSLARELKGMDYVQLQDVADQLKKHQMTVTEHEQMAMSLKLSRDWSAMELARTVAASAKATDPAEVARLAAKQDQLKGTFDTLSALDEAFGSHAGYLLRQRQVGLQGNLSDTTDLGAWADRVFQAEQDTAVKARRSAYDSQIQGALDSGDVGEAARLITMKGLEADGMVDKILQDKATDTLGKRTTSTLNKLVELSISNVFSPVTVLRNSVPPMLKVLYRPALDAVLSNPFEAETRKTLAATYSAMRAGNMSALRAAKAAFAYEQSILTRESGRIMEGEMAITGRKGGIIRFLPRILNTTDEYFSQLTYRGFIASQVAGDAYKEAVQMGLKGKAIDQHIAERTKTAIDNAFESQVTEAGVRTVVNKGINLGYTGEALAQFVKNEVQRNPQALRHGTNKEALDYARDMLYKRGFTGDSKMLGLPVSDWAHKYEQWVNSAPVMRLLGQLFFRTPVRVFEEGVRMTPGLQIIAPNFLSDLAGNNGRRSQVRAQGEALMSLAFTGTALSLYASGNITGDGAYSDWKQEKNRTDSALPEPYTIRMSDGTTFSYKNLDPIATPLKILVNAFERYDALMVRERQGEFVDDELKKVQGAIFVGTGAIAKAFMDANLLSGLKGIQDTWNIAFDEKRGGEAGLIKFVGDKLKMLVPNTMTKIAQSNDPTVTDPADWWQMVQSRFLSGATLGNWNNTSAKSYDVLGNPRKVTDTGAMWNMFSPSTPEERLRGMTPEQAKVLAKLDELSHITGVTFDVPTNDQLLGGIDMRTTYTDDGKETLQDRWNRYYRELQPEKYLLPLLESALPAGTRKVKGAKVTEVSSTINELRKAALMRLISEESGAEQKYIQTITSQAEAKAGFWDQ